MAAMTKSAVQATVRPLRPAGREAASPDVGLAVAVVTATTPGLAIRLAGEERGAVRAAGCLVAPAMGDRVLVAFVADDCFVLQILERTGPAPLAVAPADGGPLEIAATRLRLSASEEVAVSAPSLAVGVRSARLVADAATLLGQLVTVVGERLRTTVRRHEIAADHLAAKLGERVTIVDGADVRTAATVVDTVSGTMTTQTAAAVTTAKRDLRFDAERVSIG